MRRKIVKHGPSSLTVSLPIKWVKETGVKPGNEVNIDIEDNMLKVYVDGQEPKEKHIVVDLANLPKPTMKRFLAIFYKLGYDEVKFLFKDASVIPSIQRRINEMFIGYEIIEQTNQKCVIKNISGDRSEDFDNLLRRLFLVTVSLANSGLDIIKEEKISELNDILVLEMTNNKLSNYLHRLLIAGNFGRVRPFLFLIIWVLEGLADDYRDIYLYMKENNIKTMSSRMLQDFETTNQNFNEYYKCFYKFNLRKIENLRKNIYSDKKEIKDCIEKSKKGETLIYHYLTNINVRLFEIINATISYEIGDEQQLLS